MKWERKYNAESPEYREDSGGPHNQYSSLHLLIYRYEREISEQENCYW